MISVRSQAEIGRPTETVFEFLGRLEKYPLWQSGMISVEYDPPVRKGTIARGRTSNFGVEVGVEVTEFESPRRMEVHSRLGPLKFFLRYQVETAGKETSKITCITEIDTGSTYAMAESVIQDMGQVKLDSDLRSLKILLEKETS
jgi:uncharacterized membrane protein